MGYLRALESSTGERVDAKAHFNGALDCAIGQRPRALVHAEVRHDTHSRISPRPGLPASPQ